MYPIAAPLTSFSVADLQVHNLTFANTLATCLIVAHVASNEIQFHFFVIAALPVAEIASLSVIAWGVVRTSQWCVMVIGIL